MSDNSLRILRCGTCETTVETLEQWGLELICCGRQMDPLLAKTGGAGTRRHAPVAHLTADGVRVSVGRELHPMLPGHRIVWIDILAGGKCYRQFLQPGQPPRATFEVEPGEIIARAYCSIHGLWMSRVTDGFLTIAGRTTVGAGNS